VDHLNATTEKTRIRHAMKLVSMANIKGKFAKWMDVLSQPTAIICVQAIIIKLIGRPGDIEEALKKIVALGLRAGMVSLWKITGEWSKSRMVNALCVVNYLHQLIPEHIGIISCVLTTATIQAESGRSFAMTAISQLPTQKRKKQPYQLQNISDFTTDRILEIIPDSEEEVFDVEIEGTENFIANGIVSHNTRWSKRDLTGQLLLDEAKGGEKWKHISFPAILPNGKPLWPEFWSLKALLATKEAISIHKWNSQYLQNPTSEQSAIVKRSDWMRWDDDDPPEIEFYLQTVDTAFEKTQRADYSVIATWGIFYYDGDDIGIPQANIILLNVLREKCEFPRLKILIAEEWKFYNADKLIIEKRASGAPLIYELRAAGIPCSEFVPNRSTGDKICRLNACTDVFASRRVWAPYRKFADELIEEVASFPNGSHDDQVDVTSMAISYFRQGGYVQNTMDEPEETQYFKAKRTPAYY
jgi:predicted phage terminase large subunit-like protein